MVNYACLEKLVKYRDKTPWEIGGVTGVGSIDCVSASLTVFAKGSNQLKKSKKNIRPNALFLPPGFASLGHKALAPVLVPVRSRANAIRK